MSMDAKGKVPGPSLEIEAHNEEKLVAIVLTEAEEWRNPFTIQDLASTLNIRQEERVKAAVEQLCTLGVLTYTGPGWLLTDYMKHTTETGDDVRLKTDDELAACANKLSVGDSMYMETKRSSSPVLMPNPPYQITNMETKRSSSPALMPNPPYQITNMATKRSSSTALMPNPPYQIRNVKAKRSSCPALMPNPPSQITTVSKSSAPASFDCDENSVQQISCKLTKIMQLLQRSLPVKAADIAKSCEIGKSKSDVNRFLYFLKNKGKLAQIENKWRFQQDASDDELYVYAIELADRKPSKKEKEKAKAITGASSGCEYGCRPPSGNCLHLKQENHYHQHYLQVGEGSRVVFQSNGDQQ